MSFPENDRKFQSGSGKSFPNDRDNRLDDRGFASAIASALKAEFGGGPSAVKHVARLADSNERAVRNWFEAKNGPSGRHLVILMARSETVLRAVLELAGRRDILAHRRAADVREHLRKALEFIDALAVD